MVKVAARKYHHFIVRVPAVARKSALQAYVRDAVRGWAGGGHPTDPLFKEARNIVVKNTLYEMERETLMNLKKDIDRIMGSDPEVTSEMVTAVMSQFDKYIQRT